jgi:hypothetical protein
MRTVPPSADLVESAKVRQAVVVEHAAERAALRAGITVSEIRTDVVDALAAGRCGTRRPRFLGDGNDAHSRREFVWNAAHTRAYVIKRPPGGPVRVVVTVLTSWRSDFIAEQGVGAVQQAFERAQAAA